MVFTLKFRSHISRVAVILLDGKVARCIISVYQPGQCSPAEGYVRLGAFPVLRIVMSSRVPSRVAWVGAYQYVHY